MDLREEGVEGLLKKLSLSDNEKKGIKIGGLMAVGKSRKEPQAVVKILSEKPAKVEALESTLGRIWCPIRGVECKNLGKNRFLFTFFQETGKKRALEEGPWMFGKELVVVEDFDGSKTIDEVDFNFVPIWVRLLKMPLGLMNKEAGELIGEKIGEVLAVDADENDLAVGEFLRVKVRLDIRKPLMRGVTLEVGEGVEEKKKWCPLVYEYLPDFCYLCGMIGHTDRYCLDHKQKGATPQFSRSLRYIPEKKKYGEEAKIKPYEQHSMLPWRSNWGWGASGTRSRDSNERRGRDRDNWRKEDRWGETKENGHGEEKKAISLLKEAKYTPTSGGARKALVLAPPVIETRKEMTEGDVNVNSVMQNTVDGADHDDDQKKKKAGGKGRGFKRVKRDQERSEKVERGGKVEKKRGRKEDEMEVDDRNRATKLGKLGEGFSAELITKAGPADRSCTNQ